MANRGPEDDDIVRNKVRTFLKQNLGDQVKGSLDDDDSLDDAINILAGTPESKRILIDAITNNPADIAQMFKRVLGGGDAEPPKKAKP